MGFKDVNAKESIHDGTYSIRLDNVTGVILDLTYVWDKHYYFIPKTRVVLYIFSRVFIRKVNWTHNLTQEDCMRVVSSAECRASRRATVPPPPPCKVQYMIRCPLPSTRLHLTRHKVSPENSYALFGPIVHCHPTLQLCRRKLSPRIPQSNIP